MRFNQTVFFFYKSIVCLSLKGSNIAGLDTYGKEEDRHTSVLKSHGHL